MTRASKLNSSALLLIGAIGGGLVTPQIMPGPGPENATLPVAFDMISKRVVVESVIGATDGLLSTGWVNPVIETRVDLLRTDEQRVDVDGYEAVRARSFNDAVDGRWTEEALNGYLDALEIHSDHLYSIMIMSATSGRAVTDLISENLEWTVYKPSQMVSLSRLLDLETQIQGRAANMSDEEARYSVLPLGAQILADFSPTLHEGFVSGMDGDPGSWRRRAPVVIPDLVDFVPRDPFRDGPGSDVPVIDLLP